MKDYFSPSLLRKWFINTIAQSPRSTYRLYTLQEISPTGDQSRLRFLTFPLAGIPATGVAQGFGLGNTSSLTGNTAVVGGFTPFGAGSTFGGQTSFGTSSGLATSGFGASTGIGLTNSALGKSIGSSGLGGLGTGSLGTSFGGSTNSLQLQKPPLGNKRGKK